MKTTNIQEDRSAEKKQAEKANKYETLALSIDSGGAEHLMSTLTNLYSAPAEAVFREYVSNALDSHLKAKEASAIKVGIHPISGNVYGHDKGYALTVQDYGVGMDKEDVVNVYSKYAASTKRDSNEQIGAFGLGAKSALAIADRFDVTSIKNGTKLEFFIQKNERGVGVIHFVSEKKTKERNGVTITIPLKHTVALEMIELVKKGFFVTWPSGSYTLDGELSEYDNGLSVHDSESYFAIYTAGQVAGWVKKQPLDLQTENYTHYADPNSFPSFSIGGILYRINNDSGLMRQWSEKYSIVKTAGSLSSHKKPPAVIIDLPIGSVDLTPNREALSYTQKTKNALEFALQNLSELLASVVQEYMDTLELEDAVKYLYNNMYYFDRKTFYEPNYKVTKHPTVLYHGEAIPTAYDLGDFITVMETETLSKFKVAHNIKSINISAAVNKTTVVSRNHPGYGYGRRQFTHVFVYGQTKNNDISKDVDFIKRNIRSYSQWLTQNYDKREVLFYYDPDMTEAVDNKWVTPFVKFVHIDEMGAKAKEIRSIISKEMRAEREPRAKAIHYGLYIDSEGKYKGKKVSTDDIKEAPKVIIISQNYRSEFYSGYDMKYIWDSLITRYEETSPEEEDKVYIENNKLTYYNFIFDIFSRLYPDTLILFRTSKRSIAPLVKANPQSVELEDIIADWFEGIKKTDKTTYDFIRKVGSLKPEHFSKLNSNISYIIDSGILDMITNKETQAVFSHFKKPDLSIKDHLFLARFLCQDIGNVSRADKLSEIFDSKWSQYFNLLQLSGPKTVEMKAYVAKLIDIVSEEANKAV
jgi:hypothetical protein